MVFSLPSNKISPTQPRKNEKLIGKEIQSLTKMDHTINPPKMNIRKYATIDRILFLFEKVAGVLLWMVFSII